MKRLLINILCTLSACAMTGCLFVDEKMVVPEGQAQDLYLSFKCAWPKYAANSDSCHAARSLSKIDDDCRGSCELLRQSGFELEWIYRLGNWFLLECRSLRNGEQKYLKLGCASAGGRIACKSFDLDDGFRLAVDAYASSLRFAPIVRDSIAGFTEMWDSRTDRIASVPSGFHGQIQGGSGVFLLRKDSDGGYYRWNAAGNGEPEPWKYVFPAGWNLRSSFLIALSSETGKSYAFAAALEPIPNSEGASAISPCGEYRGRHFYAIWKGGEAWRRYYAWPETDRSEPLSNGTETFDGCSVVCRDGKLVVLSPRGAVDVFDAKH